MPIRLPCLLLLVLPAALLIDCLPLPRAVVLPDRSAHLLDRPFPSDELRGPDGRLVLEGFPLAGPPVADSFVEGWLGQIEATVRGFSSMTPIYFRLDGPPAAAAAYPADPDADVRLFSLDSGHRVPVRVRFVADSLGDPYLPDGTLAVLPEESRPLRSGERYAALVSRRLARRAPGWLPPGELSAADAEDAAVATVFTVQDHLGELGALREATASVLEADPGLLWPAGGLREVRRLRYEPGLTPSGRAARVERVTFADGSVEETFLEPTGQPAFEVDLETGPTRVLQVEIRTLAFQDPAGRPYQSPGLGILLDTARTDGWIPFDDEGVLVAQPVPEPLRVVVQLPRDVPPSGRALLWGHGSGGDAYEAVQRRDEAWRTDLIRERLAALGAVIVSSDQPFFGRRYPLVDEGYDTSLAVVNVANLAAFRDNVRQGAVDQLVVMQFVRHALPDLLGAAGLGPVEPEAIGVFGHSIGAQIGGVAAALHEPDQPPAVLLNGTGGFETHSVLEADLFQLEGSVAGFIFLLAGIPVPADPSPRAIFGALFGVPEAAWPGIDRHHPLAIPFQLLIDAGDPLPVTPAHDRPLTIFLGAGDSFVPPEGAAWLAEAAGEGRLVPCLPSGPYDGHSCLFREETGFAELERFVAALVD